jgi:hypothetical protein
MLCAPASEKNDGIKRYRLRVVFVRVEGKNTKNIFQSICCCCVCWCGAGGTLRASSPAPAGRAKREKTRGRRVRHPKRGEGCDTANPPGQTNKNSEGQGGKEAVRCLNRKATWCAMVKEFLDVGRGRGKRSGWPRRRVCVVFGALCYRSAGFAKTFFVVDEAGGRDKKKCVRARTKTKAEECSRARGRDVCVCVKRIRARCCCFGKKTDYW